MQVNYTRVVSLMLFSPAISFFQLFHRVTQLLLQGNGEEDPNNSVLPKHSRQRSIYRRNQKHYTNNPYYQRPNIYGPEWAAAEMKHDKNNARYDTGLDFRSFLGLAGAHDDRCLAGPLHRGASA